jgi:hypothetical protein
MNPENEKKVFEVNYDDIAQYLFEALVEDGYAPGEDELLDFADIVMDLLLYVHLETGGTAEIMMSMDDDLEEEE